MKICTYNTKQLYICLLTQNQDLDFYNYHLYCSLFSVAVAARVLECNDFSGKHLKV